MSTREPFPEHAAARGLMDKLAKAAGMPSGQALIHHLDGLKPDSPALTTIGKAIAGSVPTTNTQPPGPTPPKDK